MSLFEDTFEVTQVNPDGKKFDKGARTQRRLQTAGGNSALNGRRRARSSHPSAVSSTHALLLACACVLTDVATVNRLVARGENYLMDLVLDINSQVGAARTHRHTQNATGIPSAGANAIANANANATG